MISPHCRIELAVVGKMTIRIKDGIMSENTGNLQMSKKDIPKHDYPTLFIISSIWH